MPCHQPRAAGQAHGRGDVAELPALVAEEAHGLPFDGQGQVEVAVAIQVHQRGSVHATGAGQRPAPGGRSLQGSALVHPHRGGDRLGVAPQSKLTTHHHVEIGVAIEVAHREGSVELGPDVEDPRSRARGRRVHDQLADGLAPGVEVHGRRQPMPAPDPIGPGHHAALAPGRLWSLGAVEAPALAAAEDDRSATPSGPEDEVFPSIAVEIGPRESGSLAAQAARDQRLDERVVEGLARRGGPQQHAHVVEERLGFRSGRHTQLRHLGRLGDLVPVIGP